MGMPVVSYQFEGLVLNITLCSPNGCRWADSCIVIPEDYPHGEAVLTGEEYIVLKPGRLSDILDQVYRKHFGCGLKYSPSCGITTETGSLQDDVCNRSFMSSNFIGDKCSVATDNTDDGDADDDVEGMNSDLASDIEQVRICYGAKAVEVYDLKGIDIAMVDLRIPMTFLDPIVSNAWGVDRRCPLTLRLHLSRSFYRKNIESPKLECYQTTQRCRLAAQVRNIANDFCKSVWNKTEEQLQKSARVASPLTPLAENAFPWPKSSSSPTLPKQISQRSSTVTLWDEGTMILNQSPRPNFSRASTKEALDLLADPSSTTKDPNKAVPLSTNGFLVQLMDYVRRRIPTCSSYCVICDRLHLFASAAMLKPAVCSRDLCTFAFQQLKVGADAAEDVAAEAGVVDLLVCMAKAAVCSTRAEKVFEPYPHVFDPNNPKQLAFSPANKDYMKIRKVLQAFPSVKNIYQSTDLLELRRQLDMREPLAYPLLQWLLSSNRSHIIKLQEEVQLKSMGTRHQYLLVTEPPEKQIRFNELKSKYGSKFAFHGSPIENWHCILREGLKNASGTSLQIHGTAHGSGIYLATNASTSFGYSRVSPPTNKMIRQESQDNQFINEANMHCIALCEVIDSGLRDVGWCWVQERTDHVCTRFFFVYDSWNSQTVNANITDTRNATFLAEISTALQRHHQFVNNS
eukprot:NODE_646_length_2508_cov_21.667505_g553_i0.p1 GENE.NODE_646_length_2508_cov_21.667505_g553_i0~~NODE_646_length_2508_cov_21.667505_g553_i0.p1  ORF type:complete len:685 (-),score=90.11 NODE_646_length_2508_cov_21.667505_g553_i0:337-2391(-)